MKPETKEIWVTFLIGMTVLTIGLLIGWFSIPTNASMTTVMITGVTAAVVSVAVMIPVIKWCVENIRFYK